jgi:hypothetical protein
MFSNFVRDRPGLVILLLAALSTVPLLSPSIPPLNDVFGHIGRYRVQLDLADDPVLQRYYGFEWALIGNLGVDLLVQVIAPLIGLEPAVKFIVIAIVALTTAGFLLLSYQVHGRIGAAGLFALPLAYCFPFQFGFVNYCLSMALAFLAFTLWIKLGEQERVRLRAILFIPISVLIWLAHIGGWGALGLFAFAAEAVRLRQKNNSVIMSIIKGGLQCLVMALPVFLTIAVRTNGADGGTVDWFNWAAKYKWLLMTLNDRWQAFDLISLFLLLLIIGSAVILRSVRFSATLGFAALLLLVAFIITPRILIGSAYADMRLIPYAIALGLLAIDTRPNFAMLRRWLLIGGFGFFMARTAATIVSFYQYDHMLKREFAAIEAIPYGARVVSLINPICCNVWMLDRRWHIPSVAVARKRIFSNDHFVMAGAQLLQIRYTEARPFDRDPTQLIKPSASKRTDWRSFSEAITALPRSAFDYVWVIGKAEDKNVDYSGLTPVWQQENSIIYRIDPPAETAKNANSPKQKGY